MLTKQKLDINGNIPCDKHETNNQYDDMLPLPTVSLTTASLVTGILSLICYWNTQFAEFTFDDNSAILGNKDVLPTSQISNLFYNDFWGTKITSNTSHKSYRPLVVLTFKLSYYLANGFNPWGFHIVNIVLHAVNSILLLQVFSIIFGGYHKLFQFVCPKASLLCGVLFAVHPIHTESVAAIVGRADLLCTFFYILAFLFYVRNSHLPQNLHSKSAKSYSSYLLSLLFTFISLLCKEQGITVLGLCIAYDVIFILQINMVTCFDLSKLKNDAFEVMKRIVVTATAAFVFLLFRMSVMGSRPPIFQEKDNPASFHRNVFVRIVNYTYIYSLNIWILLNPWWLCFDWAMGCIPIITSIADVRVMAPLVLLVGSLTLSMKVVSMLEFHLGRVSAMSLAFLIVPFLPAMNIFFRVGFVIAERNLYISSIGFIMLLVTSIILISKCDVIRQIVNIFVIGIIVLFVARSIHRSKDWMNESNLFNSGANVCPLNAKVHYNIGKILQDSQDHDTAIQSYLEAIRLSPTYDQPMNNLGNIYKERKMYIEAEYHLEKAVNITPIFAAAWMNLGSVKSELKKKEEAIKCFKEATIHRRVYPDAYYNWGNLHLDYKDYAAALEKFKMAITLKNDHMSSWQNAILMLGRTGNVKELRILSEQAVKIFPSDANIAHLIGNAFGNAGELKTAEKYLRRAIEQDAGFASAYGNLAVVYHRLKRYNEAVKFYKHSLRLQPDSKFMIDNYAKLKKTMKLNG